MLILGAGGFAKEVYSELPEEMKDKLCFYDDVTKDLKKELLNRPVYTSENDFLNSKLGLQKFILGVGNPRNREMLFKKFIELNLQPYSLISRNANIGKENINFGQGVCVMQGSIITVDVNIHRGVLINIDSTIGHDTTIGEFSEICPSVNISGNVNIGSNVFIGTGAVILPNLKIGDNSIIGAGSVITKDIPNNSLVIGSPGKIIKKIE